MKVENNYKECITNLACSIRKNFDLEYKHNTLDYIDKLLNKNYKNVVLILFDGMGSRILDKLLSKDDFFIKNRIKEITTVFPATTVAATTSVTTGLNPVETGMLGWTMYYSKINKTITTFLNTEKLTGIELEEAKNFKNKYMKTRTIADEIKGVEKYKAYELMPFGEKAYDDVEDMFKKIQNICNAKDEKRKFIYAYDENPDHTMHNLGCDTNEIKDLIKYRSMLVEQLSEKIDDTLLIITADHGHLNVENINLEDYPDIIDCLDKTTSIEPRAVNFFIKKEKINEFAKLFNKYFSDSFKLYSKEDIIKSNLFGDGEKNEIFEDSLGDYLAIAYSNKTLLYNDAELKSTHAGYTPDEIYIPIIVKECKKKLKGEINE